MHQVPILFLFLILFYENKNFMTIEKREEKNCALKLKIEKKEKKGKNN